MQNYKEAAVSFEISSKLTNENEKAINNLSVCLINLGRYEDAVKEIDKVSR